MAHLLRLERNGSYITLTAGNYAVVEYVPQSPDITALDAIDQLEDGGERLASTRRNVTDSIELILRPTAGQTMSNVQTAWQLVENWLRLAEEFQHSRGGYPMYLEFQPDSTSNVYRSEILGGKCELQDNAMSRWMIGRAAKGVMIFTRRYYWEGPESELPLTTSNVTRQTGGVTLYNHDDSGTGHDDWAEITGSDVVGVMPAPIRLEVTNSYNSASRDSKWLIGQNLFANTIQHVIEGEDSPVGGSDVANANSSNGYYRSLTLPSSLGLMRSWVLSSTMLNAYKARYYRIVARFFGGQGAGVFLHLRVTFPSGSPLTVVAQTPEVELNSATLQEIGILQIPPWLPQESSFYPIDLNLYGYKSGGGTLNLDCLFLMPVDNYRILNPQGYGLAYQARIVDDGIADSIYTDGWGAAGKTGHYLGYGSRIMAWPGITSRVYIISTNDTGGSQIERTRSVRMYYRPRRLTV